MCKLHGSRNSGFAVPLAMVAVVLLLVLGTSLLTVGENARIYAIHDTTVTLSRCAADAGLTKALSDMNIQLQTKPWNDSFLPSASNVSLPGSNATYSYLVTKEGGNYVVTATGNCSNSQKQVSCILALEGPFDSAVFCDSYVWIHNDSVVDQYNADSSTPALQVGTNSTKQWKLCLFNNARIEGDAVVGAGSTPEFTIDNKGTITGRQYAMNTPQKLASVTAPEISSCVNLPTLKGGETITSGKYVADKIDLDNGKTLTIQGDVILYITGDVLLGNSSQIKVENATTDSSLKLFLGGDLSGGNSSTINNETQNPHNATIFALDSCTKINMKNDAAFYGSIYAPKAEVVYNNSAALYGSVIAKSFETKNSTPIHYDASLRNTSVNDELVKFKVTQWKEI